MWLSKENNAEPQIEITRLKTPNRLGREEEHLQIMCSSPMKNNMAFAPDIRRLVFTVMGKAYLADKWERVLSAIKLGLTIFATVAGCRCRVRILATLSHSGVRVIRRPRQRTATVSPATSLDQDSAQNNSAGCAEVFRPFSLFD